MEKDLTVEHSKTKHVQIVMPRHVNGFGMLFGGQLMEWIDVIGAVVARRHCQSEVTTACVDSLEFLQPVTMDSLVELIGQMTYVGNTSMEVMVKTYVETLDGKRDLVNKAYLVFVSLDGDGKPKNVPKLLAETEDEKIAFEQGKKRQELRKLARSN